MALHESRAEQVMRTLLKLTRALRSSHELEAALQLVADAAHALVPGEGTSVRILDEERQYFLAVGRAGHAVHQSAEVKLRVDEGVLGWVATNHHSARVDDSRRDPRFLPRPDQARDVRSLVCVPILVRGETLGVLGASHTEVAAFNDFHEELLQLLADCAAPMLELARLRHLSTSDPLTRLPNRRYLETRLAQELSRADRKNHILSLALVDLDDFKSINEAMGHLAGDRLLVQLAQLMRQAIRTHDVLVRWGGDELILLLPDTDMAQAKVVLTRLVAAVKAMEPIAGEGDAASYHASISVGLTIVQHDDTAETLVARADQALRQAKAEGGGRVAAAVPIPPSESETH